MELTEGEDRAVRKKAEENALIQEVAKDSPILLI